MTKDAWDKGIVTKLERAIALRDELKAEHERLRAETEHAREYDTTSNESHHDDPMVWHEWRLVKAPPSLPMSFSALLGDVIQNLRAALDYSAWAAVRDDIRATKPTQVFFPLCDTSSEFREWKRRRSSWFSEATVRVIDWAQPFHADDDQLHPLRILRVLSNTDKHRLLNILDHAHIELGVALDPEPPEYDYWAAKGPVAEGDLLGRLSFRRPPFKVMMDVMPFFGWYESVAYEEPGKDVQWLRLDEMMNAVCEFSVNAVRLMSGARPTLADGHAPPSD